MLKREKVCNIIRFISGALVVASVMSLAADMVHSILSSGMPVLRLYLTALYALVPYILCHLTVDRIKSLPLYVLINAIPVIAIAVFPIPTILKAILIIFSGLLIAFAASASMSGNRDFTQQPGPAVLILFVVVYLISGSFSPEMMRVNYYLAFAYAILLVIFMNFSRLNEYLEINKDVENIPYRQISRTNYGTLAIYLILMTALMVVLPLIGIDKLVMNLMQALKALLIRLINIRQGDDSAPVPASSSDAPAQQDNPFSGLTENETPVWLSVFYKVMTWIAGIAVGAGFVFLIIFFVYRIMKQFANRDRSSKTDREEFITSGRESRESTLNFSSFSSKVREFLDPSPESRIRRYYKKTILKAAPEPPKDSMTPKEAEDYAGLSGSTRESLHNLYEKARYSLNGCDKEDLKTLKS